MAVEFRQFLVGLAEDQLLLRPDLDMRRLAAAIALHLGQSAEDLFIEARNPLCRAARDSELDIGNAEVDLAKPLLVGAVEAELVAPRAGRLDVIIVLLVAELGPFE